MGSCSQPLRSIPEIISSVRTSFREMDFKNAEAELKAREDSLRRDYDSLESERSDLRLHVLHLEDEHRRLRRECEINEDKVADLARELSVIKEREVKAMRRYERALTDIRATVAEKEELLLKLQQLQSSSKERITTLEDEIHGKGEEMNRFLIRAQDRVNQLLGKNEVLEGELEVLRRKVAVLEKGKGEAENKVDEFATKFESLLAAKMESEQKLQTSIKEMKKKNDDEIESLRRVYKRENQERTEQLKKKLGDLEMEKNQLIREKEEANRKHEQIEKQVSKLEEDVTNFLLKTVPTDNKLLLNYQIDKVLDGIIQVLDSEQHVRTAQPGKFQQGASAASHIKEPASCLETGMIYEAAARTSAFETDVPKKTGAVNIKTEPSSEFVVVTAEQRENGAVGMKRDASAELIVLSDVEEKRESGAIGMKRVASSELIVLCESDSDDENAISANELKRQLVSSQCWNRRNKLDNSSDDSSNSICKITELMDLPLEDFKHKPSITASGSRSDKRFVAPQKQVVTSLRQCKETALGDKIKGPRSHGMMDDNSQPNDSSSQADVFCSPQASKLIATCRRSRLP